MIDSVRTDVLRLVDTHVKWSRPYVSRILQLKRIPPSKLQMSVCVCVCVCEFNHILSGRERKFLTLSCPKLMSDS